MHWRRPDKRQKVACGLRVAIVGGGFSGTAVLANLVETAKPGTVIELFEGSGEFGPGVAYETDDACHLLNVQAERMGAFAADHFVQWLQTERGEAVARRICPGRPLTATAYLPRALYGAYLKDVVSQTVDVAMRRGVGVSLTHGRVTDVRRRNARPHLELTLETDGQNRRFDVMVLATDSHPPRSPEAFAARDLRSTHYVANIWSPPQGGVFPQKLERLDKNSVALILGTGLTAIDAILSLEARGFEGRMIAVSRHGWLPAVHAGERPPPWVWSVDPGSIAPTALAHLHWLKHEVRLATTAGADWRAVFDALRPITRRLWRKLEPCEQLKLLRRHSLWSIHRHRMAPEIRAKLDTLAGRLEVVAGDITSARRWLGGFRVRLRRRGALKDETLRPSLVLNCTGPEHDIARCGDGLLRRLQDRFLIVRSPNGAGIAVEPDGTARGAAIGSIFAIGPLLMGDTFESTAVPELREQARWIAGRIAEINPQHRRILTLETSP